MCTPETAFRLDDLFTKSLVFLSRLNAEKARARGLRSTPPREGVDD